MIASANSNIQMDADYVLPFYIDKADVKGRAIRCQKSITGILSQHNYPAPVARLLGEALLLAALLGSGMQLKHRLIVQIKGDGALPLLVADYYADGTMRGYVECNDALYEKWTGGEEINPFLLIGQGHLAITIDHGGTSQPIQGIVPIQGKSLSGAILAYIEGSEQIMSSLKLIINQKDYDGVLQWYGAAVLIQKLGKSGDDLKKQDDDQDEGWGRAKALFHTLSDEELSDDVLTIDRLLFRLFHEDDVRVYDKISIKHGCKCDPERLKAVLQHSNPDDLHDMADENGMIELNCQFCPKKFEFNVKEL